MKSLCCTPWTYTMLWKKQESSRKTSISALLTMPKPLTVGITINCGKFFKRWECQTTWAASWETCIQVKKQQLELDMEQQTGSKLGKEYVKAVYCHPAYLLKCRVKVKSLSCIRLFATPWTVAYRASLSMGFSRQGYWSGLPCRVHHVKCQAGWSTGWNQDCWEKYQ